ncbi:hypothetical protein [Magnetospirillum molischianum]|uniref:Uncharacterized protein n=1 Tax=Magnetospirillum molischianum DSM 120 TaxID=1150626 RepID=H8FUS2_MAGML|nr:hypothetical protein [Magnetospirillum molischianum]CCG42110.1 hypothetical protein PHAMO_320079 [Magnetospirillum molischianum DSM 120]
MATSEDTPIAPGAKTRQVPLRDLPRSRFPLTFERYSRLYDQIDAAADRFADLGYSDLAVEMSGVRASLSRAWNAIATAEREGR